MRDKLEAHLAGIEKDAQYQLVETLKNGTSGRTEKVRCVATKQVCVRKYFSMDTKLDRDLLLRLQHIGLSRAMDYYTLVDRQVLIFEYVKGESLAKILQYSEGFTMRKAIDAALQICDAVGYLHAQKPNPVIHRDIKPDNIICMADGSVKLVDFGTIREYKDGNARDTVVLGTRGFAAPEQFGFGQTDARCDIHAIGITLFQMFTGELSFDNIEEFPKDERVPLVMQNMIKKATAFDPLKRYQSVDELAKALRRIPIEEKKSKSMYATPKKKDTRFFAKPPETIFPKYCQLPALLKIILLPVHLLLLLVVLVTVVADFISFVQSGNISDLKSSLYFLSGFMFFIFPTYILVFNYFNLDTRLTFFRQHRVLKKALIIFLSLLMGAFVVGLFQ